MFIDLICSDIFFLFCFIFFLQYDFKIRMAEPILQMVSQVAEPEQQSDDHCIDQQQPGHRGAA